MSTSRIINNSEAPEDLGRTEVVQLFLESRKATYGLGLHATIKVVFKLIEGFDKIIYFVFVALE